MTSTSSDSSPPSEAASSRWPTRSISRRRLIAGIGTAGAVGLIAACTGENNSASLPPKVTVVGAMRRVNDRWIDTHLDPGLNDWGRATYFEGDLAAYTVYADPRYLDYALAWGERNNWDLVGGVGTRHADHQCAGQTYIDLFRMDPRPERITTIEANVVAMLAGTKIDDWTWVDALHMAMPVFARLGALHHDERYTERLYQMYDWTKRQYAGGLYNPRAGLWWRDARFKPTDSSRHQAYWSRGNGWAFAAHVRTLAELPAGEPHRAEYIRTVQTMAAALAALQRPDGLWGADLRDFTFGTPEASGTALFVYGMAWGVHHGILDRDTYVPTIARAWQGLTQVAVQPDGDLGYVQPPADRPAPADREDHHDFGVGAFLLAASEVVQLAPGRWPRP